MTSSFPPSLLQFLSHAAPLMLRELIFSRNATAATSFHKLRLSRLSSRNVVSCDDEGANLVASLSFQLPSLDGTVNNEVDETTTSYIATSLAWSANGTSLVATVIPQQRCDRDDGRDHPVPLHGGFVCQWNDILSSSRTSTSSGGDRYPDDIITYDVPLTSLSAHPTVIGRYAVGSSDGEVLLVDFSSDEEKDRIVCKSSFDDANDDGRNHRDGISSVEWMLFRDEWHVVSLSVDGTLLFWTERNEFRRAVGGTLLDIPRSIAGRHHGGGGRRRIGGISLAVSPQQKCCHTDSFLLAGGSGGDIVRLSAVISSSSRNNNRPSFSTTVDFHHEAPGGGCYKNGNGCPVTALDVSRFHHQLFIGGGMDGRGVGLYSLSQTEPLLIVDPTTSTHPWRRGTVVTAADDDDDGMNDGGGGWSSGCCVRVGNVSFSPTKPTVFAVVTEEGIIYIYDLAQSDQSPVETIIPPSSKQPRQTSSSNTSSYFSSSIGHRRRSSPSMSSSLSSVDYYRLAFNAKERGYLATTTGSSLCETTTNIGDGGRRRGFIEVWKLPRRLVVESPRDRDVLKNITERLKL